MFVAHFGTTLKFDAEMAEPEPPELSSDAAVVEDRLR